MIRRLLATLAPRRAVLRYELPVILAAVERMELEARRHEVSPACEYDCYPVAEVLELARRGRRIRDLLGYDPSPEWKPRRRPGVGSARRTTDRRTES